MNDELKDVAMVRTWCMTISYPTETALGLWSAALHVGSGVTGWGACYASQLAGPCPVTALSGSSAAEPVIAIVLSVLKSLGFCKSM